MDDKIIMDEHVFDKIDDVDLKKTMEKYFVEYSMSVIAARALPDVRDGLKPVQLYWRSLGIPDTRLLTDTETSAPWTETEPQQCDIQRPVFQRFP